MDRRGGRQLPAHPCRPHIARRNLHRRALGPFTAPGQRDVDRRVDHQGLVLRRTLRRSLAVLVHFLYLFDTAFHP